MYKNTKNQDFKQVMLVGEQKGGIQCFVVVQWGELVEAGRFFLNELQK